MEQYFSWNCRSHLQKVVCHLFSLRVITDFKTKSQIYAVSHTHTHTQSNEGQWVMPIVTGFFFHSVYLFPPIWCFPTSTSSFLWTKQTITSVRTSETSQQINCHASPAHLLFLRLSFPWDSRPTHQLNETAGPWRRRRPNQGCLWREDLQAWLGCRAIR